MFKFILESLSKAIGFTKTETRGVLVLILIIFMALVASHYRTSYLKSKSGLVQDSISYQWMEEVYASIELKKDIDTSIDDTDHLTKKDFSKKYESTEVELPKTEILDKKSPEIVILDLNQASAEELQKTRGIGPAYSERIIKYRDMLGGFYDTTQLQEVYGLKKETISELLKHFQIKSSVSTFEINSDSIKTLIKHPYISYDLARVIINYRKEHGDIKTAEDLRNIKAMDEHTFSKLKPYLR